MVKGPIKIIMPDGKVIETGVVLTVRTIRDKNKTVLDMHGASPQMVASAREALVVNTNVILQGKYGTDIVIYYSPTAFGLDPQKALLVLNSVYANRIQELEKRANEYEKQRNGVDTEAAKTTDPEETLKLKKTINDLARKSKLANGSLTLEQKIREQYELIQNYETLIKSMEAEKEKEFILIEEQLLQSMPLAQHSAEMERLKDEYDEVNQRAIQSKPNKTGGSFDLEDILDLQSGEEHPKEGDIVVGVLKNGGTKIAIGKIYYNEITKDYVCLGQALDITRIFADLTKENYELSRWEIEGKIGKDELLMPTFLMGLEDKSIQTIPYFLHNLKENQTLRIFPVNEIIKDLMEKRARISHSQEYIRPVNPQKEEAIQTAEEAMKKVEIEYNVAVMLYKMMCPLADSDEKYASLVRQAEEEKSTIKRKKLIQEAKELHTKKIICTAKNLYAFTRTQYFVPAKLFELRSHPDYSRLGEKYGDSVLHILRYIDTGDAEKLKRTPAIILDYLIDPKKLETLEQKK